MTSSGMLRRVALGRTGVSKESIETIIRLIRIGEVGTTLPVTINGRTLRRSTVVFHSIVVSRRWCLGILSGRADYLREWGHWVTKELIFTSSEELSGYVYL
jgi:hypothetical protein